MNKIWYENWEKGQPRWLVPLDIELDSSGKPICVTAHEEGHPHIIYTFNRSNLSKIGIIGDVVWNPSIVPVKVSDMIGKTFTSVKRSKDHHDEVITFSGDGYEYKLYSSENNHGNDVVVLIDDIVGDLEDLINTPILVSELVTSKHDRWSKEPKPPGKEVSGSWTWSFYKFATAKGYVDIKWWGTSNGYYSEEVDFKRIK